MKEKDNNEIEYVVEVIVKRRGLEVPKDTFEKIQDDALQSKIDLWGKELAIYVEDKLNGKSTKRLPPAFESPYQNL